MNANQKKAAGTCIHFLLPMIYVGKTFVNRLLVEAKIESISPWLYSQVGHEKLAWWVHLAGGE